VCSAATVAAMQGKLYIAIYVRGNHAVELHALDWIFKAKQTLQVH
jgi:hypothetical protein